MKALIQVLALGGVFALGACGDNRVDPDRRYLVEPRVSAAQTMRLHPNETPELRRLIDLYHRDLLGVPVERQRLAAAQPRLPDAPLGRLAPARVGHVRVDVGVKAVLVRRGQSPGG